MRSDYRRTKKLIVAFHFQFANQAAWKCDTCRANGLERRRRCGWLPAELAPATDPVVWARGRISAPECPRSYVTAESIGLLEEYYVWKLLGRSDCYDLPARLVEAIFVLENEVREERNHAEE